MPTTTTSRKAEAKHAVLARLLREKIANGELSAGDRLPSFAEFRAQHGIALSTIEKVITTLEQDGLVERQQGRGTFVRAPQPVLTGKIGFIGSSSFMLGLSPFCMRLMNGVVEALEAHDQQLLYLGSSRASRTADFSNLDGVLISQIEDTSAVLRVLPPDLPRVSILRVMEGTTCVGVDDYAAGQLAIRELLAQGHTRIACLMEKQPSAARRRFAGYTDALLEAGIEPDPSWARLTSLAPIVKKVGDEYLQWGRHHMQLWLRENFLDLNCTAILVQNELLAFGVMQILQEENIAVPGQISVVGFDGTELCDLVSPRLSAVALPLGQIGAKAVEALNQQIAGDMGTPQTILLPASFRPGNSIASRQ